MPAVIMHHIFGEEVHRLPMVETSFPSVFYWGAQGPDVFFFSPVYRSDGRRLIRIGVSMHSELVEDNFALMADYCRRAQGTEKKVLASYLYGYLAHYILDSTMHPFVYGVQRYFKMRLPRASAHYLHRTIETNLDVIFLDRLRGKTVKDYAISEKLRMRPELESVCRMFSSVIHDNYGVGIAGDQINRSFSGMKTVYSVLYSPTGVKRKAVAAAERLMGHRYPEYAALSHTAKPSDVIDFANISKMITEDGNETLSHDAFELFNQAKRRYRSAAEAMQKILLQGGDFSAITGGVNFEGELERKQGSRVEQPG